MDASVPILLAHLLLLCSSSISTPLVEHRSVVTSVVESKSKRTSLDQIELSSTESVEMAQLLQEVEAIFLENIGSFNLEERNNSNRIASTFRIPWLNCWFETTWPCMSMYQIKNKTYIKIDCLWFHREASAASTSCSRRSESHTNIFDFIQIGQGVSGKSVLHLHTF